jgi:PAS domain-containing protein
VEGTAAGAPPRGLRIALLVVVLLALGVCPCHPLAVARRRCDRRREVAGVWRALRVGDVGASRRGRGPSRTGSPSARDRSTKELARAAAQISASEQARIIDADREDEVGELARVFQTWQDSCAEREILLDRAPVGSSRIDQAGRVVTANAAPQALLASTREEIVARSRWDFHPSGRPQPRGGCSQRADLRGASTATTWRPATSGRTAPLSGAP